jgi:hypothetical protein
MNLMSSEKQIIRKAHRWVNQTNLAIGDVIMYHKKYNQGPLTTHIYLFFGTPMSIIFHTKLPGPDRLFLAMAREMRNESHEFGEADNSITRSTIKGL